MGWIYQDTVRINVGKRLAFQWACLAPALCLDSGFGRCLSNCFGAFYSNFLPVVRTARR